MAAGLALAAFGAGTTLAQSGVRHPEVFASGDFSLCLTAVGHMGVNGPAQQKERYLGVMREMLPLKPSDEPALTGVYRAQMLQTEVTDAEAAVLAEACVASFERGNPFRNPYADRTGEVAFARYVTRREAAYAADKAEAAAAAAASAQRSPAVSGPSEQERAQTARAEQCGAIVDDASAQATRSFRAAQSLVERWLRQGTIGSAYGAGEIASGCRAISGGLSRLAMAQCPAPYFTALTDFRAGYYIGFPGGGRYDCG